MTDRFLNPRVRAGIPGIGELRWGSHICHGYKGERDLVESLVPYFKAGLLNNERCIWITAPPYRAVEAKADLWNVLPGLNTMLKEDRIEIRNYNEWYVSDQGFDASKIVQQWLEAEATALADGYEGLRIAGNIGFERAANWVALMGYEAMVNQAFANRRIVAVCGYNVLHHQPAEMREAANYHGLTLRRQQARWELS
jgi:hypothetical protein